jgi:gamma-glutamyltranspeptidase/glutathione hydrolase
MVIVQCVHSPRWHDQLSGPTYLELPAPALGLAGFSNATAAYLNQTVGYDIVYQGVSGSTSHVIVRGADGLLEAASDPRKPAGAGAAF